MAKPGRPQLSNQTPEKTDITNERDAIQSGVSNGHQARSGRRAEALQLGTTPRTNEISRRDQSGSAATGHDWPECGGMMLQARMQEIAARHQQDAFSISVLSVGSFLLPSSPVHTHLYNHTCTYSSVRHPICVGSTLSGRTGRENSSDHEGTRQVWS